MKTLKEIQQGFQSFLKTRNPGIEKIILQPKGMSVDDRLEVYQDDYFLRLRDALADDYVCLLEYVGEEVFTEYAKGYLAEFPPSSYSIRDLGRDFPVFLKNFDVAPETIEIAEFEYLMLEVLFVKDSSLLSLDDLSGVTGDQWGDLRLYFQSALRKLDCEYNTPELWLSYDEKKPIACEKLTESRMSLIWRLDRQAYFRDISSEQQVLFNGIQQGRCFAELCEMMLEHMGEDEVVSWVADTIRMWFTDGLFSSYTID